MINLLPNTFKDDIVFARRNTQLLRASGGVLAVIIGAVLLVGAGNLYLVRETKSYNIAAEQTAKALEAQDLTATKTRIQELSNGLKLILQVLSKEVLFSKLLKQAGAVMPEGSVLSTIEISEVEGGIDINAFAKDYQTATQVQLNLADPDNKLFEKVDIIQVTCGGTAEKSGQYPCSVGLRALFADNNPYLFINNETKEAIK